MTSTHAVATSPHAVAGIAGIPQKMGSIHSHVDNVVHFEIPYAYTSEHLRALDKDLELLGNLVRNHPREMCDMHNAVVEGRVTDAAAIGRKLGLHEHRFIAAGGGLAFVPIIAGILVVALVAQAYHAAETGTVVGEPPHTDPGGEGGISVGGGPDTGKDVEEKPE
jgi:hypothetical protein